MRGVRGREGEGEGPRKPLPPQTTMRFLDIGLEFWGCDGCDYFGGGRFSYEVGMMIAFDSGRDEGDGWVDLFIL